MSDDSSNDPQTGQSPAQGLDRGALIERCLVDADFRARLFSDPEATLKGEGFEPDAELVAQIKGLDPDTLSAATDQLAADFDARKAST